MFLLITPSPIFLNEKTKQNKTKTNNKTKQTYQQIFKQTYKHTNKQIDTKLLIPVEVIGYTIFAGSFCIAKLASTYQGWNFVK